MESTRQTLEATPTEERLDFFVSYTACDVHWAEWIAWTLEEAQYRVTLQKWDFRPGSNFVLEMQNATSRAERTIAVLSIAYVESAFGAPEWAAAFKRDPKGSHAKVVPVRVADCHASGLLEPLVYISLFDKDEEHARAELLAGVDTGRAKPTHAPSYPGPTNTHPAATGSSKPAFPGLKSPVQSAAIPNQRSTARSEQRFSIMERTSIELEYDYDQFGEREQDLVVSLLAKVLEIAPGTVRIVSKKRGSVRLFVELPRDACQRLLRAYAERDPKLFAALHPFVVGYVGDERPIPVYKQASDIRRAKLAVAEKIDSFLTIHGEPKEAIQLASLLRSEFAQSGDIRERAVAVGAIADALQTRGHLAEALRIRREEQLPAFEQLGEVAAKAVEMGAIADAMHAHGDLHEA
ncbi:MAG: hypothetical protein RL701_4108, partial [Pseudomonadota bacterium]